MEAWRLVRANRGAAGVDGESLSMFEKDLKGNLYMIWNLMSSGSYFPPPVRLVEIPEIPKGATLFAQTMPSAERASVSVWAGAEFSAFNPDYGCKDSSPFTCWNYQLLGIAPFVAQITCFFKDSVRRAKRDSYPRRVQEVERPSLTIWEVRELVWCILERDSFLAVSS